MAEAQFSITRDVGHGSNSGTSTIALFCAKEDLAECRVLRTRNGVTEKSVPIPQARAREIFEAGILKLTPFVPASDDKDASLRWTLTYKKKRLQGNLTAGAPVARKSLLKSLIHLESRLNSELAK